MHVIVRSAAFDVPSPRLGVQGLFSRLGAWVPTRRDAVQGLVLAGQAAALCAALWMAAAGPGFLFARSSVLGPDARAPVHASR